MALLDTSIRYDPLKEPFMGHALNDLLELAGGKYQSVGSFSFTTREEYEDLKFIDTTLAETAEIDQWTGEPTNQRNYHEISNELPTWETLVERHNDNLAEYAAYAGKRNRKYPDWREQLDLLYKDIDNGLLGETAKTSIFYQTIKQIKIENP